jgi:hypothetical protein
MRPKTSIDLKRENIKGFRIFDFSILGGASQRLHEDFQSRHQGTKNGHGWHTRRPQCDTNLFDDASR